LNGTHTNDSKRFASGRYLQQRFGDMIFLIVYFGFEPFKSLCIRYAHFA
jgi:hypothetical protein